MTEEFDFSDFNALLNKDALKDIEEASKKQFSNEPLPENVYNMTIETLALVVTKNNHPAVKCDLKVKSGEYANRHMLYWLYLTSSDGKLNGFKVHLAHTFLNSLTGNQIMCSVKDGFEKFAKEIQSVFEFSKQGVYSMKVSYKYGKNKDGSVNKDIVFPSVEPIEFTVED